ncbi:MAG: DNA primase, partial [Methanococcaceae archaeon]
MNISEKKIEEIRSSINILDLISEFVQLKKRGRNHIGLCPFHQEKTPSFTVSEEKQIYKCFGCQAGGNVYQFLMNYENISFIEAVQELAKRAGIPLDFEENQNKGEQSENEILLDINTLAAKFYLNNLINEPRGEIARNYFARRNVKLATQRAFGLGYALNDWDNFLSYAQRNNINLEKARLLGLIEKKDSGGYYDKFRDRIIFPIFSPNGRVIAFGGRVLDTTQPAAKYLNSPENPVYTKRKVLYGLYHSKDDIRKLDKAILVEGYIDLISLFQSGIKNVVASCGTALTEEQVLILSRYTKKILVFYDSDSAGIKASLRSIELLVKKDFDVKIAELPEGEDPDSFVTKFGKTAIEEVMKRALNFLEYQSLQYEKQGMFADPVRQTEAVRNLIRSASFVNDDLKRSLLLKSIAKRFNLREILLENEMEKLKVQEQPKPAHAPAPVQHPTNAHQPLVSTTSLDKVSATELDLIRLLFEGDKKVIVYIFKHITPEEFTDPVFQYLAELVYNALAAEEEI